MSFDINQLGRVGPAQPNEGGRQTDAAERTTGTSEAAAANGNGNGHAPAATNGNGHKAGVAGPTELQPLRNGALKREVAAANETVGDLIELTRRLRFEVDEASGAVVVQVVDQGSGETVRQIPGEEFLELHERLDEIRFFLVDDVG